MEIFAIIADWMTKFGDWVKGWFTPQPREITELNKKWLTEHDRGIGMFEDIEGVINIRKKLYVLSQEALDILLKEVYCLGYKSSDIRNDYLTGAIVDTEAVGIKEGIEAMEKKCEYLWGINFNPPVCTERTYQKDFEQFKLPTWIHIFEAWRWAPLKSSPTLHTHVLSAIGTSENVLVSDKADQYKFDRKDFIDMGKFIRHFTTLDADAWDKQMEKFRLKIPEGIPDIAQFCHPNPEICQGNPWTVIIATDKLMSGKEITDDEWDAAKRSMEDPKCREFFEKK